MNEGMPTWPQILLISLFGTAFMVFGYLFSRMRGNWGSPAMAVLILLGLSGVGFVASVFLFYLRPRYGARAFPFMILFLLGHGLVVALLWRTGILGR